MNEQPLHNPLPAEPLDAKKQTPAIDAPVSSSQNTEPFIAPAGGTTQITPAITNVPPPPPGSGGQEAVGAPGAYEDTDLQARAGLLARLIDHPWSAWVVLVVSCIALFLFANNHWHFINLTPAPRVVVFDPVKFMNAQRATASILAARPDNDLSFSLTQVAKQAETVILQEARGAVILVKQAVVIPSNLEDITDRVLRRFDLPTDVPTINVSSGAENSSAFVAPTDYSFSEKESADAYKEELSERRRVLSQKIENQTAQEKAVP